MEKYSVLIAASGSGGHLMPAKLIAEALVKKDVDVSFIGSGRPLEQEILGSLGIPLYVVSLGGVNNLGFLGLLKFICKFPGALISTISHFRRIKPDAVIGVGGYASVLPILFGALQRVPTWIHEAELSPGTANRYLGRFANVVSLALQEAEGFSKEKTVFTGHPLRTDVVEAVKKRSQKKDHEGQDLPKNLLILGGSQGARTLDTAIQELAPFIQESELNLYHQCRPEHETMLQYYYKELGLDYQVSSFIHELGEVYSWSDIIIARAGAGTVMEIGAINKPAIFVPFPHAQGQHQHKNAKTLASLGKALIVEEGEGFTERLTQAVNELLDPVKYKEMIQAKGPIRPLDAAEKIADGVLGLINHPSRSSRASR